MQRKKLDKIYENMEASIRDTVWAIFFPILDTFQIF